MKDQDKDLDRYPLAGSIQEEVDGADVSPVILSFRQRTFSSFGNPVFRLYYGSMLGQWAAMNMQMITRSLLIYRLTGSPAILGAMSLAHALPMLFLSIFGGVIADRLHKKYVLIMGQAASAVVAVSVALALASGYLSIDKPGLWWMLVVSSVLQGIIMALMMPSRQAIIAEIIDRRQLMNAVALNSLGMNTCRLLVPALAGVLIDAFDFKAVYFTMTGLYLIGVLFISGIPLTGTTSVQGQSTLRNLKDGFQYVRHETTILLILVLTLIVVVLAMPYQMMMPIFADDILKVGATGMGILLSNMVSLAVFDALRRSRSIGKDDPLQYTTPVLRGKRVSRTGDEPVHNGIRADQFWGLYCRYDGRAYWRAMVGRQSGHDSYPGVRPGSGISSQDTEPGLAEVVGLG